MKIEIQETRVYPYIAKVNGHGKPVLVLKPFNTEMAGVTITGIVDSVECASQANLGYVGEIVCFPPAGADVEVKVINRTDYEFPKLYVERGDKTNTRFRMRVAPNQWWNLNHDYLSPSEMTDNYYIGSNGCMLELPEHSYAVFSGSPGKIGYVTYPRKAVKPRATKSEVTDVEIRTYPYTALINNSGSYAVVVLSPFETIDGSTRSRDGHIIQGMPLRGTGGGYLGEEQLFKPTKAVVVVENHADHEFPKLYVETDCSYLTYRLRTAPNTWWSLQPAYTGCCTSTGGLTLSLFDDDYYLNTSPGMVPAPDGSRVVFTGDQNGCVTYEIELAQEPMLYPWIGLQHDTSVLFLEATQPGQDNTAIYANGWGLADGTTTKGKKKTFGHPCFSPADYTVEIKQKPSGEYPRLYKASAYYINTARDQWYAFNPSTGQGHRTQYRDQYYICETSIYEPLPVGASFVFKQTLNNGTPRMQIECRMPPEKPQRVYPFMGKVAGGGTSLFLKAGVFGERGIVIHGKDWGLFSEGSTGNWQSNANSYKPTAHSIIIKNSAATELFAHRNNVYMRTSDHVWLVTENSVQESCLPTSAVKATSESQLCFTSDSNGAVTVELSVYSPMPSVWYYTDKSKTEIALRMSDGLGVVAMGRNLGKTIYLDNAIPIGDDEKIEVRVVSAKKRVKKSEEVKVTTPLARRKYPYVGKNRVGGCGYALWLAKGIMIIGDEWSHLGAGTLWRDQSETEELRYEPVNKTFVVRYKPEYGYLYQLPDSDNLFVRADATHWFKLLPGGTSMHTIIGLGTDVCGVPIDTHMRDVEPKAEVVKHSIDVNTTC